MKTLLVDDEILAREELRDLLSVFPRIEVVGEAGAVAEARQKIEQLKPDVLFLDVQMPDGTGFDLLESVSFVPPIVIFTTAYADHALRAFEANAMEYLVKPVDPKRLAKAIARAGNFIPKPAPVPFPAARHVFVREGDNCWFVKIADLRLLECAGNYTRIYFDGNSPTILCSLDEMERRLDPVLFFRASRSQLVNIQCIESVKLTVSGGITATLNDGSRVEFSRRSAQLLKDKMGLLPL